MLEYKVEFVIRGLDGDSPMDNLARKILTELFVQKRSEAIEDLNPHYDEWNKEYENLYGKITDGENDTNYLNFMADKQDAILQKFDTKQGVGVFKLRSNREDHCDIMGILEFKNNVRVEIEAFLKPM